MIREAAYFSSVGNGVVLCELCPAECRLREGTVGICGARLNQGGRLVTSNYGELVTLAVDPIEKKPLYHFYPGSAILSTGPNCCNLGCSHCQNWTISQHKAGTVFFTPERLAAAAKEHDSIGIAFTYTEPMVWYEFIMDTAPILKSIGMKVVLVTNGYALPAPFQDFLNVSDAMNIDLKGIRPQFFSRICHGKLAPVLDNIGRAASSNVHLELTNLLIPGENDSREDITDLVNFVAELSPDIPLHFSAYHPDFRATRPPTPRSTLQAAFELASRKLNYVYLGNVSSEHGSDTHCPGCHGVLVRRSGYHVLAEGLTDDGLCSNCGYRTSILQRSKDAPKDR